MYVNALSRARRVKKRRKKILPNFVFSFVLLLTFDTKKNTHTHTYREDYCWKMEKEREKKLKV